MVQARNVTPAFIPMAGSIADLVIVAARTGDASTRSHDSLTLFLVPTTSPGFRCVRVLRKLALGGRDVCELELKDVVVPSSSVLGTVGGGFKYLMRNLARVRGYPGADSMMKHRTHALHMQERMAIAVAAVAACEVALDQTLEYVQHRRMFGKRLGDLQYPALKVTPNRMCGCALARSSRVVACGFVACGSAICGYVCMRTRVSAG